jgi:hypothetical protein
MKLKYGKNISITGIFLVITLILFSGIDGADNNTEGNSSASAHTIQVIRNTAQTIENEIISPSSNERQVGSYATISQRIVRNLIFQLADLGPARADDIYEEAKSQSSRSSTALLISLGLMSDSRVHDDIRKIVRTETDPNLRAMAVRALSAYGDTLDIPIFLDAMADTNIVVMELDVATHDGQYQKRVDIVALEAVPALYKLGYTWAVDSVNGGYKAVKLEGQE